ncbi:MAG: prepilin peptidase [Ruminococcus sp.]|nr:prepilin peptidase [Ruminococcus sp.]MBQ8905422.1 prepilin peptidase [Ruminococcus sp.]
MTQLIGSEFLDWQFYALFIPVLFLYGICIGSFLNVVIFRLPKNESLIKRSSHCMTCGTKIRKRDLIPVFSWIFLRGKCHACGEKISSRYPIVETLNGLLYIAAFLSFDISAEAVVFCLFYSLLIVIGFMDWDTLEMDLRILGLIALLTIPSILLALPGYAFTSASALLEALPKELIPRLIGGLCVSIPFFLIGEISGYIIKQRTGEKVRGIEIGDTLLMLAGGLLLGWKPVVAAAFIGIFLAAVCGMIMKAITGESKIPFGPFLAVGLFIGSIFGESMIDWYLSFLAAQTTA